MKRSLGAGRSPEKGAAMIDFRQYRDVIVAAVAKERREDENWTWSVKAVRKNDVEIGWGYLKYIGDNGFFKVREGGSVDSAIDDVFLIGEDPNRAFSVGVDVGNDRWSEADSVEEGIELVIHKIAREAKRRY